MGKYDKIETAEVTKTGQYFKPGNYRVRILAVKDVTSRKDGKNYTIIETRVLQSNNVEIPVGSEKSHVIEMSNVMAFPNLKQFISAASGVDPTHPDCNHLVEEYWRQMSGTHLPFGKIVEEYIVRDNMLEGSDMDLECTEISKKDGDPFTKHTWGIRNVEADLAEAKARREAAGN
jgi:hypothetical protein